MEKQDLVGFAVSKTHSKSLMMVLPWLAVIGRLFESPVRAESFHPADVYPDHGVTRREVTNYAVAFHNTGNWPAGLSPISEGYFQPATFIWRNGESYRQITNAPPPQAWVPAPFSEEFVCTLPSKIPFTPRVRQCC